MEEEGGGSERGLGQYGGANKMLTAVATAPPPPKKKKMLSTKIKPRSFSLAPKTTAPMSLSQGLTDKKLPQKAP